MPHPGVKIGSGRLVKCLRGSALWRFAWEFLRHRKKFLRPNGKRQQSRVGHVRSHSEFGCEFLDKGRNPLTVDFKLRGSLDLMLVLGSGCSQQAFAFGVAGCPQKSSVQQCQSAPKFAIHVGPKT